MRAVCVFAHIIHEVGLISFCSFYFIISTGEDVIQALRNVSEDNAEQDTNEDGDVSENNEETMDDL